MCVLWTDDEVARSRILGKMRSCAHSHVSIRCSCRAGIGEERVESDLDCAHCTLQAPSEPGQPLTGNQLMNEMRWKPGVG